MKNLLFLFAFIGIIFAGCADEDDRNNQNPGGSIFPALVLSLDY